MDNLITISDFKGLITIANATSPAVIAKINSCIADGQNPFFIEAFGYPFFKEMETALNVGENETVSQEWTDFIEGVEIEFDGELHLYNGLKEILSYYIFAKYISENFISVNGSSVTIGMNENSSRVDNSQFLTVVWNRFVRLFHESDVTPYAFLTEKATYPDHKENTYTKESWL